MVVGVEIDVAYVICCARSQMHIPSSALSVLSRDSAFEDFDAGLFLYLILQVANPVTKVNDVRSLIPGHSFSKCRDTIQTRLSKLSTHIVGAEIVEALTNDFWYRFPLCQQKFKNQSTLDKTCTRLHKDC